MLSTGQLPMSCAVCSTTPAKREQWGCDKPNESSTAFIDCPLCNEDGKLARGVKVPCVTCGGGGRIRLTTCPRKCVGPEHTTLLQLYALHEKGIMPDEGAGMDQLNVILEAFAFVSREYGRYEQREMDKLTKKGNRKR